MNSQHSRFRKQLAIAVAVTIGAIMAVGELQFANAGTTHSRQQAQPSTLSAAFAESKHISVKAAHKRLAAQGRLVITSKKIRKTLKPDWSAGDYVDTKSGKLTVNVTSKKHAKNIDAPDTTTRVVTRSTADLNKLRKSVDKLQKKFRPRGVTYYVDVRKNVVSITVARNTLRKGKTAQFVAAVRKLGPGVRINTNGAKVFADYGMKMGSKITSSFFSECTAGWWVKDKSDADLVMTAGHCLRQKGLWYNKALHIGGRVDHNYGPMDWGTIHVDDIASPRPTTRIEYGANGKTAKISGKSQAPVGTEVCKTGSATQRTCGPIKAHNVTVTRDNGVKLEGMSQAKYVGDGGDSGGPVYQMDPNSGDHVIAQGMHSGSPEGRDPQEVSTYQPIESALKDGDLIFVKSRD